MKNISMVVMTLVVGHMMTSAAYAASDACCGAPTCFCYKAENGDWKKGTTMFKIPANAETKGLQFKEAGRLDADKKAQPQGNEKQTIFDRWGLKTKEACKAGGGVWAGPDGNGSCSGPRK